MLRLSTVWIGGLVVLLAASVGYNLAMAQRVTTLRTLEGQDRILIDACDKNRKTDALIVNSRLNVLETEVFGAKPVPAVPTPVKWPKNRLDEIDRRLDALEQFRLREEKKKD
jgi:hypothetical protein